MLQRRVLPIDLVYVPAKRRRTVDAGRTEALAEDIMEHGQKTPIQLREDGDRYVLIEGLHRLEALRALGETEVAAVLVQARVR